MRGWLQCSARRSTIWSCTCGPAPPERARKGSSASSDQRMALRECDEQGLRPQRFRMTIGSRRHTDDKGDVKPRLANLPNGVARSPLRDLQIDCRMQFTKLTQ